VVPHPGVEDETAQTQNTKAFEAAVLAELQSEAQHRMGVESVSS
jgi:hypothetical protein